ncbi:hypothetical protein KUL113_51400 [Tenacibaculum sp. KUL113]|nr:hypothetical protein KUL113_51400 [Tenacibaculum sp. KUL113]
MTERKLIAVLTDVCETAKQGENGFVWLTHTGHWRTPQVVAVFTTEHDRKKALSSGWDTWFINQVNIALDSVKSVARVIDFESEEACNKSSNGDWEQYLSKRTRFH